MTLPLSVCPRCAFAAERPFSECPRCGVVVEHHLRRARQRRSGAESGSEPDEAAGSGADGRGAGKGGDRSAAESPDGETARLDRPDSPAPAVGVGATDDTAPDDTAPDDTAPLDRAGARVLLIGGTAAVLIYLFPFTRFVASYLAILVHELGHTAAAWLFGYSAIPTFDFLYGGGITFEFGRHRSVVVLVVGLALFGLYRLRGHRRLQSLLALLLGLYLLLAVGEGHRAVIVASGHGTELVVSTLFWFRALRGDVAAAERPLYAFCAAFLQLSAIVFALRLATSALFRAEYGEAKGGGHWMDFDRLAASFGVDLGVVALLYLLAALLPALVAWLVLLNRRGLVARLVWLAE